MVAIPSTLQLLRGQHRLFPAIKDLIIVVDALTISGTLITDGRVNISPGHLAAESKVAGADIRLPVHGPMLAALQNRVPDVIEIAVVPTNRTRSYAVAATEFQTVQVNIVSQLLVTFFENHRSAIEALAGTMQNWPSVWNFARVVRNSAAHGGGINITNPRSPAVSWRGLSYSAADNGRQCIGGDLMFADVLLLVFELNEELDRLGCP